MIPDHRLALTDWQPYADLIMAGVKDVENRSWPPWSTLPQWGKCWMCGWRTGLAQRVCDGEFTDGPSPHPQQELAADGPFPFRLWIHAAMRFDSEWRHDGERLVHPRHGAVPWIGQDRLGVLVGAVTVPRVHHADECRVTVAANCADHPPHLCSPWAEPGRWHWTLTDPQPLATPIPVRGRQKLWTLPDDVHAQAVEQLEAVTADV